MGLPGTGVISGMREERLVVVGNGPVVFVFFFSGMFVKGVEDRKMYQLFGSN